MRVCVCLHVDADTALAAAARAAGVLLTSGLTIDQDPPAGTTHLLVVGTSTDEADVRRIAAVLEAATGLGVAWRALPVGPSAAAHIALRALSGSTHPATVLAEVDALTTTAFAGAWLPSVSKLDDPSPGLRQHLRSWAPGGAGFLAVHSPERAVLPVGTRRVQPGGAQQPAPPRGPMMVCGTGAPEDAVAMAVDLAGASSRVETAAASSTRRYGTACAVELVALVPSGVVCDGADGSAAGQPACDVCCLELRTSSCPYCRVTVAAPLQEAVR